MKRYLLLLPLLLGFAGLSQAQNAPVSGAGLIPFGGTLPTTCTPANVGDPDAQALFYHTTSSGGAIGLYQCTATNTWTAAGGGVGTVTSVSGTTNQIDVATGTTTPVISLDPAFQFSSTAAGALTTAPFLFTGAPITGGTGTTTVPLFYFNSGASNPTTFNTNGAFIGINAPSGFVGNFFDFHVNGGASEANLIAAAGNVANLTISGSITATNGGVTIVANGALAFGNRGNIQHPADGVLANFNTAGTGFTRLAVGPDTTSFPALCPSGTTLQVMVAGACTTFAPIVTSTYGTGTICKANGTAANPSVASCSAAAAGMFSCATNASGGTCQVNTTAVTANSTITITQNAADGGASQLNVTCNTASDLPSTAPILASKSAGTSFTINLGTVSTNPACFEYTIVN